MNTSPSPTPDNTPTRWVTINNRRVPIYENEHKFDAADYERQRRRQDRSLLIAATVLCVASLAVQGVWMYERNPDLLSLIPAIVATGWLELGFLYSKLYERSLIANTQKIANKAYQVVTGVFVAYGLAANMLHNDASANSYVGVWLIVQPFASVASLLALAWIYKGLDPVERANDAAREAALNIQLTNANSANADALAERRQQRAANMRYAAYAAWEAVYFVLSFPFARQHRQNRHQIRQHYNTIIQQRLSTQRLPTNDTTIPTTDTTEKVNPDDIVIIPNTGAASAPTTWRTHANDNGIHINTTTIVPKGIACPHCGKPLSKGNLCTAREPQGCYYRRRRAARTNTNANIPV
ncbi:MAG: hypothetical protein J0L94_01115 [Rhodothermia bacterium]|nr:hypothetical protein [Rhodothermia bacterium]